MGNECWTLCGCLSLSSGEGQVNNFTADCEREKRRDERRSGLLGPVFKKQEGCKELKQQQGSEVDETPSEDSG